MVSCANKDIEKKDKRVKIETFKFDIGFENTDTLYYLVAFSAR